MVYPLPIETRTPNPIDVMVMFITARSIGGGLLLIVERENALYSVYNAVGGSVVTGILLTLFGSLALCSYIRQRLVRKVRTRAVFFTFSLLASYFIFVGIATVFIYGLWLSLLSWGLLAGMSFWIAAEGKTLRKDG